LTMLCNRHLKLNLEHFCCWWSGSSSRPEFKPQSWEKKKKIFKSRTFLPS
jgi:hypothetical protein